MANITSADQASKSGIGTDTQKRVLFSSDKKPEAGKSYSIKPLYASARVMVLDSMKQAMVNHGTITGKGGKKEVVKSGKLIGKFIDSDTGEMEEMVIVILQPIFTPDGRFM